MIKNSPKMGDIGLFMAKMVKVISTNTPKCGRGSGGRGIWKRQACTGRNPDSNFSIPGAKGQAR